MAALRTWFVILLTAVLFQQSTTAQKILLQENSNTGRITRYRVDDEIIVKTRYNKDTYRGVITNITDSTLTVNNRSTLMIYQIGYLRPPYKHELLMLLANVTELAGFAYPVVDITNRVINKDWPIPLSTAYVSGGFLATAGITNYFLHRHYTIRGNRKLRVVDVSVVPVKE